jgi:hypothetical protein
LRSKKSSMLFLPSISLVTLHFLFALMQCILFGAKFLIVGNNCLFFNFVKGCAVLLKHSTHKDLSCIHVSSPKTIKMSQFYSSGYGQYNAAFVAIHSEYK